MSSRVEERPREFTTLPSTAKDTGNATVFYEIPHVVNVRVGANYITRSLFAIGGSAATDIYSEARTSVDFGSRYFFCPGSTHPARILQNDDSIRRTREFLSPGYISGKTTLNMAPPPSGRLAATALPP